MLERLVDLATIAEAVGVHVDNVQRWTKTDFFPPHFDRAGLGGAKRWRVEDLPTGFARRGRVVNIRAMVEAHLAAQAAAAIQTCAPSGDPIPAGLPSPADTSPAATGAGGVAGAGGAGCAFAAGAGPSVPQGRQNGRAATAAADAGNGQLTRGAGSIPSARTTHSRALAGGAKCPAGSSLAGDAPALPAVAGDPGAAGFSSDAVIAGLLLDAKDAAARARIDEALKRYRIIAPLLAMPERGAGRRAAAESAARHHGTSWQTIYRWTAAYKRGGIQALIDGDRRDKGTARALISTAWETAAKGCSIRAERRAEIARDLVAQVRGLWAQQGRPSWRQVAELAGAWLARTSIDAGMPESLAAKVCRLPRRFVEGERRFAVVALASRDAKAFYDQVIPSVNRTRANLMPGDLVIGDVTPLDVPVLRDDWTIGWPRLIVFQDAATNWLHATVYVPSKGSGVRREHVALAFCAMCAESPWGLPRRLYLDNGSEFKWEEMLDAWAALTGFSGGLFGGTWGTDVLREHGTVIRSIPFRPRGKSIEGQFGNLLNYLSWIPGFAGSDRLRKKVASLGKGVEPQPYEAVKAYLADALAMYHGMPQDGHLLGKSPAERMQAFRERGFRATHVDRDALALAFSDREERRVRAGTVTAGGMEYYHPELIQYHGEKVLVRWPRHAPDCCFVFHRGRLIATALAMPVFEYLDPDGARYAARLANDARQAVTVMRGMCAAVEPRDLMGELARLRGVHRVVDESMRDAVRVECSPEARAMLEARHKAALEAVEAMAKTKDAAQIKRWAVEEDPELELLRQRLG